MPLAEDILVLSGDGPQQELEAREAAGLVRTALSTLEREDRELFVRRYYYGQTVARAAEEMGDEPVYRQKQAAERPGTAEGSIEKGGI